ncbi:MULTISPECIES: MauE/DoxX family redox-associated membrane protein [unclassified Microbacterium]|uniref:MauE/DoxX family redox-associated membrane protein n=1 Tax=unclassified Microbacterium TaxID=2609290 RepID=UPI003646DE04
MPVPFAVTLPLLLAGVLLVSAVAKLRSPGDLREWEALGVPRPLRRAALLRLHPCAEGALGIAVAALGGWLGALAGTVAAALMLAYTVLVVRAAARGGASCTCFGAPAPVTGATVVRNIWLTALAVGAALGAAGTPLLGGALVAGIAHLPWLLAALIAVVTTALVLWRATARPSATTPGVPVVPGSAAGADGGPSDAPGGSPGGDELEYVRRRTPSVPVTLADGTAVNLRELAARKPLLLLALSSMCEPCETIRDRRAHYRALLPEVDVRLLLVEPTSSRWAEREEPQSLHDRGDYVAGSIEEWATPSAVLLGADGLLAGGPVTGDLAVEAFIGDVYEALHGERPPTDPQPDAATAS